MLGDFLHWMGLGLCHQLPERSYIIGGVQAPVCVRDTGIYVGFLIAFILVALIHRGERPTDFPRGYVWAVMGVLLTFMAIDGITSYGGLRTTTNQLRLITGLGVGFSASVVVVPMLNDGLWRRGALGRVLDPRWRFLVWLGALPVSYLLIETLAPRMGVSFLVLNALAIVATLTAINLVIVAMLPAFDRRAERVTQLALPIVVAIVVSFAEIALAAQLRTWLVSVG